MSALQPTVVVPNNMGLFIIPNSSLPIQVEHFLEELIIIIANSENLGIKNIKNDQEMLIFGDHNIRIWRLKETKNKEKHLMGKSAF